MKGEGPLGIRTGVWITVFGLVVLAGLLTMSLFQRPASRPTTESAVVDMAGRHSSDRPQAGVPWTSRIKFTPKAPASGSDDDLEDALSAIVEPMTQDRRTWTDVPGGEWLQ